MSLAIKAPDLSMEENLITAEAISFNGSSSKIVYANNFFRDTDMRTSQVNNAFTLSFWFKPNLQADQAARIIDVRDPTFGSSNEEVYSFFLRAGSQSPTPRGRMEVEYRTDDSNISSVNTPLNDDTIVDGAWNHFLYSAKQLGSTDDFDVAIALNGVNQTLTKTNTGDPGGIPTSTLDTFIGAVNNGGGGSNFYNGCLSEMWMDDRHYDLSVASNIRLFRSTGGKPVELPASPLVYLRGNASTWANTGSSALGTQTLTSITNCADSPSG